ncbi:polysaccharide biosynthesis tyrosine autokinase [Flavobacteriales bacterium]|nr:polysaccharide biosynthesis tyrosine autokinase [Flavobacteriales bacterium]
MKELENVPSSTEEKIDIKALLKKFISYWYYFILSIIICVFVAWGINRYTRPVYKVSATILIEDNSEDHTIEIADILVGDENLENQKQLIKSFSLAESTITELNLGVSYFKHGLIRTVNQYKNSPFKVEFDSTHLQLAGIEFFVTPISANSFNLEFECEEQNTYDLILNKKNNKNQATLEYNKDHSFGDSITNDFLSFKLIKTTDFKEEYIGEKFSFTLHSLMNLRSKYVKDLNVESAAKDATVLKLSIEGHTYNKIVDYLNTLMDLHIKGELKKKNLSATKTLNDIKSQIPKTKDTLNAIQNKLKEFEEKNPEILDEELGAILQKQKTEGSLSEYQIHLSYYNELLLYLQNSDNTESIVSPTSIGISNSELQKMILTLIELKAEQKTLELSATENHPKYQSLESDINYAKQSIIENVKNSIITTNSAKRELKERIYDFDKEIEQLPERKKEYVKLKRGETEEEKFYSFLKNVENEMNLAITGATEDHRVINYAGQNVKEELPVSPKSLMFYLIMALVAGISIPVIIISLRDYLNETILSKSDLTKITNIPIIGVIGNSDRSNNLVVLDNPKSVISESFRALRTNIQYLASDKKSKVITLTSSVGSEGKTFCSSNLALIMAAAGYKTILIGADLRKPKTHENFNIDNLSGLSSYLINKSSLSDIIHKTDTDNLSVISSGPVPPNPAELLNSDRMKKLISELKETYEYIILDTPPSGLVTDSVITMKMSDINLYIVRHNYTKENMLNIINDLHNSEQVKNINIIINDYIVSSSSYGYGYGYGYGNGYGYYE